MTAIMEVAAAGFKSPGFTASNFRKRSSTAPFEESLSR
jgi:hypothetical protein